MSRFALIAVVALAGCAGAKSTTSRSDLGGGGRLDVGLRPDAAGDGAVTIPDGPAPDRPSTTPDQTVDSPLPRPDTLARDTTVDTLRPDTTVDTLRPDTTVDTMPVELCSNGRDDDSDGYVDCADSDCYAKSPCVAAGRTFVIHEVYPGTPDYIAIRNAGTGARNLSGYRLTFYGTGPVSFTLPSRTLASGQVVYIFEYSAGTGAGDINTGDNLPFYNGLVDQSNGVLLRNPSGTAIDYVGLGDPTKPLAGLPSGSTQSGGAVTYAGFDDTKHSHFRSGMVGKPTTYQKSDWTQGNKRR